MNPRIAATQVSPPHAVVLATLTAVCASQACAQAAATPATAASAPAEESARGALAPQEVVITAQKRTERLKDTPVAASVISQQSIERSNASSIADINQMIPSVELKGSFNGRVPMAIRGISTNADEAAIGLTSGVSIMIDGVPVPSDSTAANELQDIKRVEVLKGPQSTLGGQASAGVINFVTNTPTRSWTAHVGTAITNDHETRLNGFVSGPLSDIASLSVSLYDTHREYPIHNLLLGQTSRSHADGGRAKLLLSPDSSLDITFSARLSESGSTGETFTYQYITPGAALFPFFPWNPAGISQQVALPGVDVRYGNTDYASPVAMSAKANDQDFVVNIEKRIGGYSLTSTTAQQSEIQHLVQDVPIVAVRFLDLLRQPVIPLPPAPGVPPLFDGSQHFDLRPKSLTEEAKIASPVDGFVSYVAGLFYSKVNVQEVSLRTMFVNPVDSTTTSNSESLDLYGRATWSLADSTSLLTGLRLNHDKISYSIVDRAGGFASSNTDAADATVGDLTLRQQLGKDRMVYATYARGYKPRAFNTAQTLTSDSALAPVRKESINHFELGAKASFLDGALSLNAAAFSTRYRDYQVQIYDNSSVVSLRVLSNAGEARTRGLELDATLNASSSTVVNLSGAYIDAEFVKYTGAPCYPTQTEAQGCTVDANGSTQDLSGRPMPDSPKLKLTLDVDQALPEDLLPWSVRLNANYAYRTSANFQADNNPYTVQKGFGILNLGATFTSPSGRHTVSTFVNNVANRFYLVNAEDFFSGLWNANAVIGQPARDARRYVVVKYNLYFD